MAQGVVFVSEVGLQPLHKLVPISCFYSSQLFTNTLIQILPFSPLCVSPSLYLACFSWFDLLCSCHSQLPTVSGTWVNRHSPNMNLAVSLKTVRPSLCAFISISTHFFHPTFFPRILKTIQILSSLISVSTMCFLTSLLCPELSIIRFFLALRLNKFSSPWA